MKKILKTYLKLTPILMILIIITLILYGFVHESAHYITCGSIGLKANFTINLLQNPPLYMVSCDGINEKPPFSKFIFWGAPYIVSLIVMVLLFLFLRKDKFYLISIPTGIIFSDALNVFGFYQWTYKIGELGNDLLHILIKTPRPYFIVIAAILGLTAYFYVLNLIRFYKQFIKHLKHKNLTKTCKKQ